MPDLSPGEGLRIGAGIFRWKQDGEADFRDLGEFASFEVSMDDIVKLEYKSNKSGAKSVVRSIITEKRASCTLVLNSITAENLALALGSELLEEVTTNHYRFGMMSSNVISGVLALEGTNDEGELLDFTGRVEFAPAGTYSPISEEWNELTMSGEIIADDDGSFGFWDIRATDSVAYAPPTIDGTV